MNERTKEFAKQAGWSGLYTTYNEPTGKSNWEMVKESIVVPVTSEQIERFVEIIRDDERKQCSLDYLEDCNSAIEAAVDKERQEAARDYHLLMRNAVKVAILRERENCAKLCDELSAEFATAERCADSIRARGEK